MTTNLRGVFLTSENPAKTADFYIRVAGLALEELGGGGEYTYWRMDKDGVQLAIHEAARFAPYAHPAVRESNLTHLYFKIDSQEAFLERLAKLNINPQSTDEVVVTVLDPDGRRVMFGTA